jgi:NADH-quinone oxidoreductase subunit M
MTNGFVGEFLILNGTFISGFQWGRAAAIVATSGVLLGAVYMLWMVKRVFWGPENQAPDSGTAHAASDLNLREIAVMVPLVILIFWMGLHHVTFTASSEKRVEHLLLETKAPPAKGLALSQPNQSDQSHSTEQGAQLEVQQ